MKLTKIRIRKSNVECFRLASLENFTHILIGKANLSTKKGWVRKFSAKKKDVEQTLQLTGLASVSGLGLKVVGKISAIITAEKSRFNTHKVGMENCHQVLNKER